MVKAFQFDTSVDSLTILNDCGEELSFLPEVDEHEDDETNYIDLDLDANVEDEMVQVVEDIMNASEHKIVRNPCLAHLLQLAIKDAIVRSPNVNRMINKVNTIVRFFHKNTHYYTKLRECNGNLTLLKPCVTRWNAQHDSLKRFVHEKRKKVKIEQ